MIQDIEDSLDANGIMIDQKPTYGKMLNAKVALQVDKNILAGRTKQEAVG